MNIKDKIKNYGLNQWEIAEKINISEFTFSRWMRRPERLSKDKIDTIDKAIEEIKKNRKVG